MMKYLNTTERRGQQSIRYRNSHDH